MPGSNSRPDIGARSHRLWRALCILLLPVISLMGVSSPAEAGGALALLAPGRPFLWPGGGTGIPFNPDRGGLGNLDHAAAVALTENSFRAWQAVPSATSTYINKGDLPVDVDVSNFFPFLIPDAPDGQSAIVYDQDGSLFRLLFGSQSGVAGFSGPEFVNTATGEIVEGVAFLNGGTILAGFPEFETVEVHEFGHFNNLGHAAVNGQVALGDSTGPTPHNSFKRLALFNRIETMYPFLLIGGGQASPDTDDIAALSSLYPAAGFAAATGTISGSILDQDGTTRLSGVNVIARNVARPLDDAFAVLSGDATDNTSQTDPLAGTYILRGLTPGATYALFVDEIFAGGFSTPPLVPLPSVEEFYNGDAESFDPLRDDPSLFTGVTAVAGSPITGVDIIFNRFLPGEPLPFRDDSSVQLFLPFSFRFCGGQYREVFLNANGNLTFGRPDADFSESAQEMLAGPPRVAGLWDDLSPQLGGSVIFTQAEKAFTVSFTGVPEFPGTGGNSFSMQLLESPPQIKLTYGPLTTTDGLAGFSCGTEITSGQEPGTDFSQLSLGPSSIDGRQHSALYEQFIHDNDLAGQEISFRVPKNRFKDKDEPNNTVFQATPVTLPFNSAGRFTAIQCSSDDDSESESSEICTSAAGDVDFFMFQVEAGMTLVAETLPGNPLDTVLGLFRAAEFIPSPAKTEEDAAPESHRSDHPLSSPGAKPEESYSPALTAHPLAASPTASNPYATHRPLSVLTGRTANQDHRGRRRLRPPGQQNPATGPSSPPTGRSPSVLMGHAPRAKTSPPQPDRSRRVLDGVLPAMTTLQAGQRLATDDDGGSGQLSRIVFPVTESGTFVVAVSTFPDLDFTGTGEHRGRYVLDLQSLDGTPLSLADDGSQEIAIEQFSFPYQGRNWSSVFVNSNGNLTFGRARLGFRASVRRFINGPPRIAPLWSDLDPERGGRVLINQDKETLTVRYVAVPGFMSTQGNTFSVTLHRNGTITMDYGALAVDSALVGITQGQRALDPGPVDLSAAAGLPATGTHYQTFLDPGDLDLSGLSLLFTGGP